MRKYWLLATFLSLASPILHAGIVPTQALAQTAISQDEKLSTLFSKTLSSVEMKRSTSIQSLLYVEPFDIFIDPHAAYDGFLNIYEKATDPALRRYAAWRMTLAAEQLGRPTSPIPGQVSDFFVSFPFENSSTWGFTRPFEAERGFDTAKALRESTFDAAWQPYHSIGHAGIIQPQDAVYIDEFGVVYLAAKIKIDSKKPMNARLEISSATPVTAWINGTAVAHQTTTQADMAPIFGTPWAVTLNPGENLLILKLASLETKPSLRVFLTDPSGAPLSFTDELPDHIVSGALPAPDEALKPVAPSLYETWFRDESLSPALRAFLAQMTQNHDEAQAAVRDLLMRDIDKTASLGVHDILLATKTVEENWMTLEILRAALKKHPKNALLGYAWTSASVNAAGTDSSAIRLIDILPELRQYLSHNQDPMLRSILEAGIQLSVRQRLTARQILDAVNEDTNNTAWLSVYLSTIQPKDGRNLYLKTLAKLYETNKNTSLYLIEQADAALDDARASKDPNELAQTLVTIRSQIKEYLSRQPYDNVAWQFWLNIVDAYAVDVLAEKDPDLSVYTKAGWRVGCDAEYAQWIGLRPNDPDRWQRYAAFATTMGDLENSETAYTMASSLRPQDEVLRARSTFKSTTQTSDRFELPYIVKDIPSNSDPSATSHVSLLDQRITRILPNGLTSTYNQLVFEILDEAGVRALRAVPINYSPNDEEIEIISVTTTHKDGSVKRVYKKNEYNVADPSIRMYFDQRQIVIEIPDLMVGDRVDFQFRRTETHRAATAIPFYGTNLQLQTSFNKQWQRYIVISPKDVPVHFYRHEPDQSEGKTDIEVRESGDEIVSIYEVKDTPRILFEERSPGITEITPFLFISTFDSWQQVSDWFIELAKPQWIADDAIQAEVKRLTQGVSDRREIVRIIYNYVLRETRYVALEFGIHGHKPYPVPQIFQRKFGDCKDKASLLKVMLETAGIKTNFVLLRTSQNGDIDARLPSPFMFDHAIAYVPEFDLFLDGTAEYSGSDELPDADQGALALIIGDDASYTLRKTPVSSPDDNLSKNEITFDLKNMGDVADFTGRLQFRGDNAPIYRGRYAKQDGQTEGNTQIQLERFKNEINNLYPGSEIDSVNFGSVDDLETPIDINYRAKINYAELVKQDGDHISVQPLLRQFALKRFYTSGATRKFPLQLDLPITFDTNVTVLLPPGKSARLPQNTSIANELGSFELNFVKTDQGYNVHSVIKFFKMKIAPSEYAAWQDFLNSIEVALNERFDIQ